MVKFFVYVIKSSEGYRYTGMTQDLTNRINEHNSHSKSFWTKRGNDWKLVYSEEFGNKADALKRERWMKSGHGKKFLKNLGM